jgi:hypothetical protein
MLANVRTYLRTETAVKNAFGERIFVLKVPDNVTYPFAVLRTVADTAGYTYDAEAIRATIFQVDVFDDEIDGAYTNYNLIRSALAGYSGTMNSQAVGSVFVREGQDQWMTDARHFKVFGQFEIHWTV